MENSAFYENMYTHTTYAVGIGDNRIKWMEGLLRDFFKTFKVKSDAVVLEVGAGFGDLRHIHPNWHGIEYSKTAIVHGAAKYGQHERFQQGDATKITWNDESVDALYSFATLEHIPEVELAFSEIMRVLKPGGVAYLRHGTVGLGL